MALESEFKNNPKLVACARYDKDHIGEHYASTGDWVVLIKKALNAWVRRLQSLGRQPFNQLNPRLKMEIIPETNRFDVQTGNMVEVYKSHYKIFNRAGRIDRIVGINTVQFLDKELIGQPPVPPSGVLPPLPPFPDHDNENLNDIFAGNNFKFKMLDSVSGGEVVGGFLYAFAVWDLDNNRIAAYHYKGIILTLGVPPLSESGEGTWTGVITTSNPIQVDQFGGVGDHSGGGPGVSRFRLTFGGHFVETGFTVLFPLSFSKSFGMETGNGTIRLIHGSVGVFKGP